MHISEGVLAVPVLLAGAGVTVIGLGIGLKKIDAKKVPEVSLLSATFFVASLIHVPIGPSNAHLVLNGLLGVLLGWGAFPAIFIGLFLQAILFQFGGLTTLGINTANMAIPAVVFGILAKRFISLKHPIFSSVILGILSAVALFFAGLLVALSLWFSGKSFLLASKLILLAHIPIAVVEGIITAGIIRFLLKVKPEIFGLMDKDIKGFME